MAPTTATTTLNLGFLTIVHEGSGYLGGYLVTNLWGRPLEFRLSTAVQPNRIQQILYGGTLQPYICADLIGKALVDKTSTAAQYILTDRQPVLDLRLRVGVPVIWLATTENGEMLGRGGVEKGALPLPRSGAVAHCHPRFPDEERAARELLDRLDGTLDLAEPFTRIREAISEARKMGVTSRN